MTGSKVAAEACSLTFMVGGDEAVIESLKPLFAGMGKVFFRMGETGKGQAEAGDEPPNRTDFRRLCEGLPGDQIWSGY